MVPFVAVVALALVVEPDVLVPVAPAADAVVEPVPVDPVVVVPDPVDDVVVEAVVELVPEPFDVASPETAAISGPDGRGGEVAPATAPGAAIACAPVMLNGGTVAFARATIAAPPPPPEVVPEPALCAPEAPALPADALDAPAPLPAEDPLAVDPVAEPPPDAPELAPPLVVAAVEVPE